MAWGVFSSRASSPSPDVHSTASSTIRDVPDSPAAPEPSLNSREIYSTNYAGRMIELNPDDPHPRLNLPFPARLMVFSFLSFSAGFLLGSAVGGPEAALRYRALNAHRLPTSTPGWYLYHKSKNYHTIVGGVKVGLATGLRTTAWGALFLVVEEVFDRAKGQRDFTSSTGAGLTMAGLWSLRYHSGDVFTGARTAKMGLVAGTGYGLLQDGFLWLRGEVPPYVRWARKRWGGARGENARGILLTEGDKI